MTDNNTDSSDDPERQTYRLKDSVDSVVRSGLVLTSDDTIEAYPDILNDHGDVLEPVDDSDADTTGSDK